MAEENKNAQRPSSKFDFSKPETNKFDFSKEEDEASETVGKQGKKSGRIIAVAALTAVICAGIAAFAWHNSQNASEACRVSQEEPENRVAQTTEGQVETPSGTTGNRTEAALGNKQKTTSEGNAPDVNDNTSDKSVQATSEQIEDAQPVTSETAPAESVTPQKETEPRRDAHPNSTANANTDVADVEKMAMLVIRGDYGNGERRKVMLAERYSVIQNRVNEIYREKEGR